MYTEIIKNLKDLIEKMKREKNLYDDYVNSLALYNDEKKMENLKNIPPKCSNCREINFIFKRISNQEKTK